MALIAFCILNHEDREDRKEQTLAHLASELVDLLADKCTLVENKTVDVIHPLHRARLIPYLELSGRTIGFLINCKAARIKDGIQHMTWRER